MAVSLKFGTATSNEGFTPHSTSSFTDLRPARIIRELIQNSLDAAVVEAGEDTAIMRFQVDDLTKRQIPDLKGYEKAFARAVGHQTAVRKGKLTDAAQQVVDHIRHGLADLQSGKAAVLLVADNGVGLDTTRMNSLLGDGFSAKSSDSSGSYGVGHLAPMSLSDLRYMLYGGVTQNGNRIVTGRTVLASHPRRQQLHAAQGYLVNGFRDGLDGNLYDFMKAKHPRILTNSLDGIASNWGHGSVVMMLAFNSFRTGASLWEVVSRVAAYNFCPAIFHGRLLIEVTVGDHTRTLDARALEHVLEQDKERTRAARSDSFFEGLRPSGRNAYSILRTLADHRRRRIVVDGGAAYLSLRSESPSGGARVDLFRNGMWITDDVFALRRADFTDRQPFHAVIEVDARVSGDLHKLVRKAEGPMHDSLSFSLLSTTEGDELRRSLRQMSERIKGQVAEVGHDGYVVDDFLLVDAGAADGKGGRGFSFWGIPTVASRNRIQQVLPRIDPVEVQPPDVPVPPNPPLPPQPPRPSDQRERGSRPLPFRSVVVPVGDGKLRASIATRRDCSEAWVILRVDENADITCDRIWPDEHVPMTSFTIRAANGTRQSLESRIESGGRVVSVCGFCENTTYELEIKYRLPRQLAGSVGTPVFRLELHRPPNSSKRQGGPRNAHNA